MKIEKCKWKYDKQAPVMFMIDDLANKYIKLSNNKIYGGDWGAKCFQKDSFWDILNENILKKFPYVKTTMFLVVGKRSPIILKGNEFYSETIDGSSEFSDFINELSSKDNIELAYHGYTHGIATQNIDEFREEWETFHTLDEAIDTIEIGKKLFEKVTNKVFLGGKYCGYKFNEFSDKSIVKSGFQWWCRHWDAELFYSNRENLSFELEEFEGVVDIPSTIDGSFYSLRNISKIFSKKYLKALLMFIGKGITLEKQIKFLADNKYIISIQEHTSPYRVDKKIQYPNIVSDKENLNYIFKYLQKYNLWYATGSEIAQYYKAYSNTNVRIIENKLLVESSESYDQVDLTIKINCTGASEIILYNDNETIKLSKHDDDFIGEVTVSNKNEYTIKVIANKE